MFSACGIGTLPFFARTGSGAGERSKVLRKLPMLVDYGVRMVQIYSGGLENERSWDGHKDKGRLEVKVSGVVGKCELHGTAEFRERDVGGTWVTREIGGRDLFVARSRTPYEVGFASPPGQELETLSIHIEVEPFLAALEARYPGRAAGLA